MKFFYHNAPSCKQKIRSEKHRFLYITNFNFGDFESPSKKAKTKEKANYRTTVATMAENEPITIPFVSSISVL